MLEPRKSREQWHIKAGSPNSKQNKDKETDGNGTKLTFLNHDFLYRPTAFTKYHVVELQTIQLENEARRIAAETTTNCGANNGGVWNGGIQSQQ